MFSWTEKKKNYLKLSWLNFFSSFGQNVSGLPNKHFKSWELQSFFQAPGRQLLSVKTKNLILRGRTCVFLSLRWTHPAGQSRLVERLVCRNELGVTQQRHRQLGCYADLQQNSSRRRRRSFNLKMTNKTTINLLPPAVQKEVASSALTLKILFIYQSLVLLKKVKNNLWRLEYQLLHSSGGRSRCVVVSDQQHLFKVFMSRRVRLGRPGHVLTLKITKKKLNHPSASQQLLHLALYSTLEGAFHLRRFCCGLPAAAGSCGGRPTSGTTLVHRCQEG